jgi:hypothetical protein
MTEDQKNVILYALSCALLDSQETSFLPESEWNIECIQDLLYQLEDKNIILVRD